MKAVNLINGISEIVQNYLYVIDIINYCIYSYYLLQKYEYYVNLLTTQHAMPPELGGKWRTECLNTRFPLAPDTT